MGLWRIEVMGKVTHKYFPTGISYCGSIILCIYGPAKTQFSQYKILALGTHAYKHSASKIIHSMKVIIDEDIFAERKIFIKF